MSFTCNKRKSKKSIFIFTLVVLSVLSLPAASGAREVYVANSNDQVTVIDTNGNEVSGSPIDIWGEIPTSVAIEKDGEYAYVPTLLRDDPFDNPEGHPYDFSGVDTENKYVRWGDMVPEYTCAIAMSPTSDSGFITNMGSITKVPFVGDTVNIETTCALVVTPATPDGSKLLTGRHSDTKLHALNPRLLSEEFAVEVGGQVSAVATTPDGRYALAVLGGSDQVRIVDLSSKVAAGEPIPVGDGPVGIAVNSDGTRAYTTNSNDNTVSVIDVSSSQVIDTFDNIGDHPEEIALSPNGSKAFIGSAYPYPPMVWIVDTSNGSVIKTVQTDASVNGIAVMPNQGPQAKFSVRSVGKPGVPVKFDAGKSSDPDGSIAWYDWYFGDGTSQTSSNPTVTHKYKKPGEYNVELRVTDNEGGSDKVVSTGPTVSHNGTVAARYSCTVLVRTSLEIPRNSSTSCRRY